MVRSYPAINRHGKTMMLIVSNHYDQDSITYNGDNYQYCDGVFVEASNDEEAQRLLKLKAFW